VLRILAFAAATLLASPSGFAQSSSNASAPSTAPASSAGHALPHDHHEGLTISVDPYTDSERAKDKFGKAANPVPIGILPVEVFVTNELPHPLKINMEAIELEVYVEGGKQDLDWLPPVQVATLIVHPGGNPSSPSTRRFPIGLGLPGKDKKVDKIATELRPFALDSDVVPPLGKLHGFLFFNMNHNFEATAKSTLYVPDVAILPERKPLMFFEVPLSPEAPAQ
jgi:hypothetical protein